MDIKGPILNTSLRLSNLIPDSLINTNPDNSLNIVYNHIIDALNNGEIYTIPNDTSLNFFNYGFINPIPFSPGAQFPVVTSEIIIDNNDSKISEMGIKSGKVKYRLTNQVTENLIYEAFIPGSADANGNVFRESIMIPKASGGVPGIIESEFDLSGYTFDLTGANGASYNRIEVKSYITVDPNGSTVYISSQDSVFYESIISQIRPEYAKGYLGQDFINGSSTNSLSIFKLIKNGTIDLDKVTLDLNLKNYAGADLQVKLNELKAINNQSSLALNHSIINQQINLSRATIINDAIIPTVQTFNLNEQNSNIDAFIELLADSVLYDLDLNINPLGDISGGNDFLFLDQTVQLGLDLKIPLSLITNNLTLVDTISYSANNNNISEGVFDLIAENSFPFDANVQLYILDQNNLIIDSLFNQSFIYGGTLNGSGIVDQPRKTVINSTIPVEKMKKLNDGDQLVVKAIFNTTGSSFVSIYDQYSLDLLLIGDFNFTAKIN